MSTASPVVITKLQQLKADAVLHRERILKEFDPETFETEDGKKLAQWVKSELAFNFMPMFESTVDAIMEDVVEELADIGQQVDEFMGGDADMLSEETAQQIVGVFEQGRVICNLLEAVTKHSDQTTKKRCANAIRVYRTAEIAVRDVVTAIVVADEGDDPDADQGDQGDQGEPAGEAEPGEPANDDDGLDSSSRGADDAADAAPQGA